jgi:outer membrane lipoprotein carrier protein
MKKLFISALLFMVTTIYASPDPADSVSALLSGFHNMSAEFTQTTYDVNKQPMQKSAGVMALSRPGKFRWEITQPNAQLLIADGSYLWIYDIDLAQATRQKLNKNKTNSPAFLLSGSIESLKARYHVVSLTARSGQTFRLTPKNSDDLFKWIELDFLDGKLKAMQLSDNLGSLSSFEFKQVKLDPEFNPSLFQFKAPKGVDVIQN